MSVPYTDARTAEADLLTGMSNIIYLKSGKAINMEEAKRIAKSYLPTALDNEKGQLAAMNRIAELADDATWLAEQGMRPEVVKEFFATQAKGKGKAEADAKAARKARLKSYRE